MHGYKHTWTLADVAVAGGSAGFDVPTGTLAAEEPSNGYHSCMTSVLVNFLWGNIDASQKIYIYKKNDCMSSCAPSSRAH